MKKLLEGIAYFKKHKREECLSKYQGLEKGQSPYALFITCADSRIEPHLFTLSEPGDLLVVRNVGNRVPKYQESREDVAIPSAIEFAVGVFSVSNIIVCGHSECVAMHMLVEQSNEKFETEGLSTANAFSQTHVLQQIENIKTYPIVNQAIENGSLQLHAWWFDLKNLNFYRYDQKENTFCLI